jgi:electron transfer flavoprotein alpha subunit
MSNVLILVETLQGSVRRAAFAGISMGQQVAQHTGGSLNLVLIGQNVAAAAAEVAGFGASKIFVAQGDAYKNDLVETGCNALEAAVKACQATVVAASSSSLSKDLLPRLASRLGAGMASDVLSVVDGKTFTRPMWAGNITATSR